jgi:hypothetical protein
MQSLSPQHLTVIFSIVPTTIFGPCGPMGNNPLQGRRRSLFDARMIASGLEYRSVGSELENFVTLS